ncbi:MAG: WYL domain-containing transcriptional regulator [Verrucomicrobia bacterium]|nr:WYL domain-containing transcriptional regulator [Verrucomicrobiota bacterium]MCH8528946.1 transcriptional regulator [Kiritimatiellia bacterium]
MKKPDRRPPPCRSQYTHLVTIAEWLRENRCPGRNGIAEKLEISTRTVSRIMDTLRDRMGAPVAYDRVKDRYYLTESSWFLPQVALTEGDLFALLIARQSVAQYRGTPVEKTLERIFDKIAGDLKDHISIHNDYTNRGILSFAPSPVLPVRPEIWNVLLNAARKQQTVQIAYHSLRSSKTDKRLVDPHHILNMQGDWYLFARDHRHNGIRQFQLHRIRAARPRNQYFEPDPGFDPEKIIQSSFGSFADCADLVTLRLHIRPPISDLLADRTFHPQQTVQKRKTGFEISFPVSAAGDKPFFHVLQWILSMGRHVTVLEPEALIQIHARELQAAASQLPPAEK